MVESDRLTRIGPVADEARPEPVPADAGLSRRLRARLNRVPASMRIWTFSAVLGCLAVILYAAFLRGQPTPVTPIDLPWLVLAGAFFAGELNVVDVHFRREKHSFTLSELPQVIGFFLFAPDTYFLAMLVGTGAGLLYRRQQPLKLAFNVAAYALVNVAAMTVFYAIDTPGGIPDPVSWMAAFAATSVAAVLSAVAIASVITISGGAPQFEKLPEMIQFGGLVAVANTSLALLAVCMLWIDPRLLALLIVPLLAVFVAYRAYGSEREKHERLELLLQSSRIFQHSPELDSALAALLEYARLMFRAERAEVLLWPRDGGDEGLLTTCVQDRPTAAMQQVSIASAEALHRRIGADQRRFIYTAPGHDGGPIRQAMATPLLGDSGLIGSMLVANRMTEGTPFAEDDLRLLETLANQAAAALETGQLEQSLAELSRLKEELRHQAYHDPLTGLANRRLFVEQVDALLGGPVEDRVPVVLFLDLDNFKDVNDSLGHPAGDQLLTAVAERVRSCIRSGDAAARLGGDEFAVLLLDEAGLSQSVAVATRLIDALAVTFPVNGQDLKISASIGIASGTPGADLADDLLRNADVAMYTAKHAGKNRFAVFEPTMHAAIVARHALSNQLASGVASGEIDVFYQPLIVLATGSIYGVEALARWHHPTRGLVGPDEFIPLAEESGAILALGRSVLFEACREAAAWRTTHGEPLAVSVNLSAAQLAQERFVEDVVDIVRSTGFDPRRLILEMTETVMFHDTATTITRLANLRALGVRIAIDDFGTGYSSLGYLRRFQVDILKIAREFVAPAGSAPDEWAFANSIVGLGRTLDLRVIAEGIEDGSQLDRLLELGCEFGQGFLFARPAPGEAMAAVLATPAADLAARYARSRRAGGALLRSA